MSEVLPYTGSVVALTGDYEKDLSIGANIRAAAESLQFAIGDWVLSMEEKYLGSNAAVHRDLSEVTGVPVATLRNYAYVSQKFDAVSRLTEATWSHHQAAAGADDPVQVLAMAQENGYSVRDTKRLAKGLPLGGEDTAKKESSAVVSGASMEEAALECISLAATYLNRAVETINKPGFRFTVPVAQSIQARLEETSKPFLVIEALLEEEAGAYL